jgi:hypothetical protein
VSLLTIWAISVGDEHDANCDNSWVFCAKNITVLLREPFLNCLRTTQGDVEPVPPFDLNSST